MKKSFYKILLVTTLALALCACGNSKNTANSGEKATSDGGCCSFKNRTC